MIGRRRKQEVSVPMPDEMRAEAYELLAEADRADAIAEADRNRVPLADAVTVAQSAVSELERECDDARAREAEAQRRASEAQQGALAYAQTAPTTFDAEVETATRVTVATELAQRRMAEAEAAATARAEVDRRLAEAQRTLAEAVVDLEDHDRDVTADPYSRAPAAYEVHITRVWPGVLLDPDASHADRQAARQMLDYVLLRSGEGAEIERHARETAYAEVAERLRTGDYDTLTPDGLRIGGYPTASETAQREAAQLARHGVGTPLGVNVGGREHAVGGTYAPNR